MGGTSSGEPAKLLRAGDAVRDLSNVLWRACTDDPILVAGGAVEQKLVDDTGDNAGFGDFFVKVAQDLLTKLMSASGQAADGAAALWWAGGQLKLADGYGFFDGKPDPSLLQGAFVTHNPDGTTSYEVNPANNPGYDGLVLTEDRDHHWVSNNGNNLSFKVGSPTPGQIPNSQPGDIEGS